MAEYSNNYYSGGQSSGGGYYRAKLYLHVVTYSNKVVVEATAKAQAKRMYNYGLKVTLDAPGTNGSATGHLSSFKSDYTDVPGAKVSKTYTYTRTKSSSTETIKSIVIGANDDGYGAAPGSAKTASHAVSVPALARYTVTYNIDGQKSSDTKWYGEPIPVRAYPTKTGWTCTGWYNANRKATYVYPSNVEYNGNQELTPKWVREKRTISLDKRNGQPSESYSVDYGTIYTFPATDPVRSSYKFLGWSPSSTATNLLYSSGESIPTVVTENATYYAVWTTEHNRPTITDLSVERCNSSGNPEDEGTYALLGFSWGLDSEVGLVSMTVKWWCTDAPETVYNYSWSNPSNPVSSVLGSGDFNVNKSYVVLVSITDSAGNLSEERTIVSRAFFTMDVKAGGHGISFGSAATNDGFKVDMPATFTRVIDADVSGNSATSDYARNAGNSATSDYARNAGNSATSDYARNVPTIKTYNATVTTPNVAIKAGSSGTMTGSFVLPPHSSFLGITKVSTSHGAALVVNTFGVNGYTTNLESNTQATLSLYARCRNTNSSAALSDCRATINIMYITIT